MVERDARLSLLMEGRRSCSSVPVPETGTFCPFVVPQPPLTMLPFAFSDRAVPLEQTLPLIPCKTIFTVSEDAGGGRLASEK
jgi:hypothetical protein